jgi:DNA-binding beta-propeller fold protein YncE
MRCGNAAAALLIGAAVVWLQPNTAATQALAPKYQVDASWPKPLPNQWVLGGLGGVCVDALDHVFILHRQDVPEDELKSGRMAPLIIELDPSGSVVNSWGDLSILDARLHSCYVDSNSDIWIASSPSGMIQKYSHDGRKMLMQIGKKGVVDSSDGTVKGRPLNSDAALFFMPSSIYVDPSNGNVFVADGESRGGNRRVAVVDRSGMFLHQWQPEGMDTVHCLSGSNDGLIYVCDRQHGHIQVYDKAGRFSKNIELKQQAMSPPNDGTAAGTGGSADAFGFSPDAEQRWLFVINQAKSRIEMVDRQTGAVVSSFGRAGNLPGEFDQPHGLAVDSKGNVYIAENRGRRVQKFVPASGF